MQQAGIRCQSSTLTGPNIFKCYVTCEFVLFGLTWKPTLGICLDLQEMWLRYLTVKRRKWSYFIRRLQTKPLSKYTSCLVCEIVVSSWGGRHASHKDYLLVFLITVSSLFLLSEMQDPVPTWRGQQHQRKDRKNERRIHSSSLQSEICVSTAVPETLHNEDSSPG